MSGWKKPVLVALATAPIGFAIVAFVFMARSELAFDEARCPYRERETRTLAQGVIVREDARACQDGVEEHRWVLLREGREEREIGRRRLDARLYGEGYAWRAREVDGLVRLEIDNPGQDRRVFREAADDAGIR